MASRNQTTTRHIWTRTTTPRGARTWVRIPTHLTQTTNGPILSRTLPRTDRVVKTFANSKTQRQRVRAIQRLRDIMRWKTDIVSRRHQRFSQIFAKHRARREYYGPPQQRKKWARYENEIAGVAELLHKGLI